jgi:hypothetical protein
LESIDPFARRLLRLMARIRSSRVPAGLRAGARGGGRVCRDLTDPPAGADLRCAHELVVRRPAALTVQVLDSAPRLLAVVLPERARLPMPVAAELARRQIAVVWRQRLDAAAERVTDPVLERVTDPVLELVRARPIVGCAMTRRGAR